MFYHFVKKKPMLTLSCNMDFEFLEDVYSDSLSFTENKLNT